MEYKDVKSIEANIEYHVTQAWWLSQGATTKDDMYSLSKWLEFWPI